MKSIKSILKIAGAVMAVIGTVLVVVGFLDEICAGVKKLAACRARREEMKDYADRSSERPEAAASGRFSVSKKSFRPAEAVFRTLKKFEKQVD